MTQKITSPGAGSPSASLEALGASTRLTRALLACGVVAGPLFIVVVLIQMFTRDGFDPRQHPLSFLSLGDLGWIQITNFAVAGLLFVAAAAGMRRVLRPGRGGTWGSRLIGTVGVALLWGGVFVADPAEGFPPGTPPGAPDQLSWHGVLHAFAPVVAILSLIVACFVFARRFTGLGRRGWAACCTATGLVSLIIVVAAFPAGEFRLLFAGVALLLGWASILAAHLMSGLPDVAASSNAEVEPRPSA